MVDTEGSSRNAVKQGQIPQSPSRRSELGLKLQAQAPGQEGNLQESVQGQHWTDGKPGRSRHPQREGKLQPPLTIVSFPILEFLSPEFQLIQDKCY